MIQSEALDDQIRDAAIRQMTAIVTTTCGCKRCLTATTYRPILKTRCPKGMS